MNELGWVRRGMDAIGAAPAQLQETVDRDFARAHLSRLEHTVAGLARVTTYAGYVIRYSLRPTARALAATFQILAFLAQRRGDPAAAGQWYAARRELLDAGTTWRLRTRMVRERGAQTHNCGLAFGLRSQTHEQVEVPRAAAQYPP